MKTVSFLYNAMLTDTNMRNVLRQGGISSMVDTYSYQEVQIAPSSSITINASNLCLISTDTPVELRDSSGNTLFTINSFLTTDAALLNFIIYNGSDSTATVITISC